MWLENVVVCVCIGLNKVNVLQECSAVLLLAPTRGAELRIRSKPWKCTFLAPILDIPRKTKGTYTKIGAPI